MVVLVFTVKVQPALRAQTVRGERARRGKVLGAWIKAEVEDYRAELEERQEQLLCQEKCYSPGQCLFDIVVAYCPKALPQGPNETLLYSRVSCLDGDVIRVFSRGGTKEDDFLSALRAVIGERGWRMELTCESESLRE